MLGQNLNGMFVDLDLPLAGHPSPLKADIESTRPSEQASESEAQIPSPDGTNFGYTGGISSGVQ